MEGRGKEPRYAWQPVAPQQGSSPRCGAAGPAWNWLLTRLLQIYHFKQHYATHFKAAYQFRCLCMRLIIYPWPTSDKPEQWPAWRKWVRDISSHGNDRILSAILYIRLIIRRLESTALSTRHSRFREWARTALNAGARAAHRWTKGAPPEFAPILNSLIGVEDEQTQAERRAAAWHAHWNVGKTSDGRLFSHFPELPSIPAAEWGEGFDLLPVEVPSIE